MGDTVHAVELQRSGLEIKVGFDDRLGTAVGLEALAWGVGALGQHKRAAHFLGAAQMVWDSTAASLATLMPELVGEHDKSVAAARAALGDQGYAAAFRRGRQMPLAQALNDAELTRRSTRSGRVDAGGAGLLTSREEEIVGLLAQGLSNKAIADLWSSPSEQLRPTSRTYWSNWGSPPAAKSQRGSPNNEESIPRRSDMRAWRRWPAIQMVVCRWPAPVGTCHCCTPRACPAHSCPHGLRGRQRFSGHAAERPAV